MREFCTSGSVRGAVSNGRPYREPPWKRHDVQLPPVAGRQYKRNWLGNPAVKRS